MTRQAAPSSLAQGTRAAVCAALAVLALSGAMAPAHAAEQSCPPGLFSNGNDECLKPSETSKLPLDDRQPMRFVAQQESLRIIYFQGTGTITPETPAVLRAFLATDDGQMSRELYLHSPGGDLAAGIELGEIIRKARLNASIGRTIPLDDIFAVHHAEEADCIGACALALLGGVARSYEKTDRYGLPHLGGGEAGAGGGAISAEQQATGAEREAAGSNSSGGMPAERPATSAEQPQPRATASGGHGAVTAERLVAYLDRMGVARELLEAAPTQPGEIAMLPPDRGEALGVIFEPSGRTVFKPRRGTKPSVTFEIVTRQKDLKGWIFCLNGEPRLTVFDPSRRLFALLEGMANRPATFKDPHGRIVKATVTHVPTKASGIDPALVFRIPGLTAAAFEGSGLSLEDIQRAPSRRTRKAKDEDALLGSFAWMDLMIDLPFTVAADNAQDTLPEVLRACRATTKPAKARKR